MKDIVLQLECNASWYDLTPLRGNYMIKNKSEKYYINMCIAGKYGVGGIMELDGKNYVRKIYLIKCIYHLY